LKVETTRFGSIDVPEDKVITMPEGMVGFPDKKRFCIIPHKKDSPFYWYQCLDDPALAFVITNPWLFKSDYHVDVEPAIEGMGLDGRDETKHLECYVTVTIPKGEPEKMTANLIGPIVICPQVGQAVQIVLAGETYSHKHPLVAPAVA